MVGIPKFFFILKSVLKKNERELNIFITFLNYLKFSAIYFYIAIKFIVLFIKDIFSIFFSGYRIIQYDHKKKSKILYFGIFKVLIKTVLIIKIKY